MQRAIHYLTGLAALFLFSFFILTTSPAADKTPAKEKLPVVEKMTHKKYTETIKGSKVKFEMVPIPAGKYMRGSPATEKGRNKDEGPQHPVQVKGFWMGKCEVTWDEFDLFWRHKPGKKEDKEPVNPKTPDAVTRPTPPYADETFDMGREGMPVICISHHTAMQYCRWLSIKTGKLYRLPTEAEWEWAARAGTTTAYFFGDDPKNLGDYAWYSKNSDDKTQPVGKKKANPWGLHDILGNAAEWCIDHYKADQYSTYPKDKLTLQPVLKPSDKRFSHPVRGGGWIDDAPQCRCASRQASNKTWLKLDPQRPKSIWWLTSAEHVGFRIVRPIEEQANLKGVRSLITRDSD